MLIFTFEEEGGVLGRGGGHSKIRRENWGVHAKNFIDFRKTTPPPLPVKNERSLISLLVRLANSNLQNGFELFFFCQQ